MRFSLPDKKVLVYCLLLGLLITLLTGYTFGLGDQRSFLPAIYRQMDPTYLLNDFKVNGDSQIGAKYYFNHMLAFLGKWIPLHVVFFLMAWLTNVFVALATYLLAKDLFKGNRIVSWLAVFLVLCFEFFDPGALTSIVAWSLLACTLSQALILMGFWAFLRGQTILGLVFCIPAILFHPQLSTTTAMIALAASFVRKFLDLRNSKSPGKNYIDKLKPVLFAMGIIVFVAWAFFIYHLKQSLSIEEFKFLTVDIRNSHHMKPSTFDMREFWALAKFLLVFGLSWIIWWKKSTTQRNLIWSILAPILTILALCLGGYVFVEIIPVRFWISVQAFRLLFLVKWVGTVVISGGTIIGLTMLYEKVVPDHLRKMIKERFFTSWNNLTSSKLSKIAFNVFFALSLPAIIIFSIHSGNIQPVFKFFLLLSTYICFVQITRKVFLWVGSLLIMFMLILTFNFSQPWMPAFLRFSKDIQPVLRLHDHKDSANQLAEFARTHTEKNAVFLVPYQGLGCFRIVGKRAVVIDFHGFSFTDTGLVEWKKRVIDCYSIDGKTFPSPRKMISSYQHITTARILALSKKYGFSYAVLHSNTPSDLPIIFWNKDYKIVQLNQNRRKQTEAYPTSNVSPKKTIPEYTISTIPLEEIGLEQEEVYFGDGLIGRKIIDNNEELSAFFEKNNLPATSIQSQIIEINGRVWELYKIKAPNNLVLARLYTVLNNLAVCALYTYKWPGNEPLSPVDLGIQHTFKNFKFPSLFFKEYLYDQLKSLSNFYHEPFLWGKGEALYSNGVFFGFVFDNKLLLQTNKLDRDYIRSGMHASIQGQKDLLKNFHEVSHNVIHNKPALLKLIRLTILSREKQ